jgi:type II secretory pathway predicted ATPase ExeA
MSQHPLTYENGARLDTPPLKELLNALTKFAFQGCVCLLVYGMPRTGKSTASIVVAERVQSSKAALVYSTVIKTDKGSFSTLLQSLQISRGGHVRFPSLKTENAFIRQVIADCDELGTQRVWILVDEAQYLSYEQLIGLKGTLTDLARNGLAPFVVLFAQPEMLAKPQKFKSAGDASLVHRFVSHKYRLRGLQRAEFPAVLRLYDETIWPEDGMTYTQHFAPKHWEQGWRMTNLAAYLTAQFTRIAVTKGQSPDDVPIAYFMEAATSVLQDLDEAKPTASELERRVRSAVDATGLEDTDVFLGDLEARSRDGTSTPPGRRRRG